MEKEYSESTRQSVAEYDKLTDDKNLMQASKFFAWYKMMRILELFPTHIGKLSDCESRGAH